MLNFYTSLFKLFTIKKEMTSSLSFHLLNYEGIFPNAGISLQILLQLHLQVFFYNACTVV